MTLYPVCACFRLRCYPNLFYTFYYNHLTIKSCLVTVEGLGPAPHYAHEEEDKEGLRSFERTDGTQLPPRTLPLCVPRESCHPHPPKSEGHGAGEGKLIFNTLTTSLARWTQRWVVGHCLENQT
jgi:hypothetical protein